MNENTIDGSVKSGVGDVEDKVGQVVGDDGLQAKGAATKLEGGAQKIIGGVQDGVNHAAEGAKAAVSKVGEQARDIYGQAQQRVQSATSTIDPFVTERPYAALGVAAAAGLILGLLLARRGPRVVYVEPRS